MDAASALRASGCSLTVCDLIADKGERSHDGDFKNRMATRVLLHTKGKYACKGLKLFARYFDPKYGEESPLVVPGISIQLTDYSTQAKGRLPVPMAPQHDNISTRLLSFKNEPHAEELKNRMAVCGFWVNSDQTITCWWCGLKLEETDNPLDYHVSEAPNCSFIRAMLTRDLTEEETEKAIDNHLTATPAIDLLTAGVKLETMRRVMRGVVTGGFVAPRRGELLGLICDDLIANHVSVTTPTNKIACKICLDYQIDVALVPCGHLCCCLSCSKGMISCPVCRQRVRARHLAQLT